MGVPGFFLWLLKNYKKERFILKKSLTKDKNILNDLNNIDYFLVDTNCMIHPVCFKVLAENPKIHDIDKLHRKMYKACIEYLEKIIMIADPKKGIYIAIDGVAPISKIKQQRSRRFKSVYDRDLYNNIRKKYDKEIPFYWTNSCITPGTKFMRELDCIMKEFLEKYSKKHKLKILYSSCYTPGEGEHKLLQYIYKYPEYKYVTYGLDADLIFLTLATGKDDIYLLREANQINRNKTGFDFVSLNIMKNAIFNSFNSVLIQNLEFSDENIELNKTNIINDFIFICYLMGNDFLPHLPSLDIYQNAIDVLIDKYIECYYELREYMIVDKNINTKFFKKLIEELYLIEEEVLVNNYSNKKKNRFRCDSNDPYDKEIAKIENLMFKIDDPVNLGLGQLNEFRERYYSYYFHVESDDIDAFADKMVEEYLIGLKWVTLYYFDSCPSWDYYYPYDYPPFITDIYNYVKNKENIFSDITFESSQALAPYEQLLCVLPKQSNFLLPKPLRKLMLNLNSSLAHLYPIKYNIDLIGKKKYWMGIPQLPPLEIDLVKKVIKKYYSKLSESDMEYNKVKDINIYN
jgi:5'-3' exoribonuclease 2